MKFDEVVRTLEKAGSAQTRKTYARHGIGPNMYGTSYATINAVAKKIKTDQALAEQLYRTGNHECCTVAHMIADPQTIRKSTLTNWVKTAGNRCAASELAKLVSQTPFALELSAKWCASKKEIESQLGWNMIACLAQFDPDDRLDELFESCLEAIELGIGAAPNDTRYAMNGALIAIGGRNAKLKKLALAAAKRIGKVEVDHGDTACKTPDAAQYIAKIWARKK